MQVNKKEIDIDITEKATAIEAFFFFLHEGFLPWNKRINTIAELEELIIVNEKLVSHLKTLIAQEAKVAERLVYQFSKKFISKVTAAITAHSKNEYDEIFSMLEKLNPLQIDEHTIDAAILKVFASDARRTLVQQFFTIAYNKAEANVKPAVKEILQQLPGLKKNTQEKHTKDKNKKSIEPIYLNNAGLVLLHPFLNNVYNHHQKWLSKSGFDYFQNWYFY